MLKKLFGHKNTTECWAGVLLNLWDGKYTEEELSERFVLYDYVKLRNLCRRDSSKDYISEKILFVLCMSGNNNRVRKFLQENNVNVNVNWCDRGGWTSLLIAAHRGHTEVVRTLLEYGVSVDKQTNQGWTAFLYAVFYGHVDIMDMLHVYGANVRHTTRVNGVTPLMRAAYSCRLNVVRMIVKWSTSDIILEKDSNGLNSIDHAMISNHPRNNRRDGKNDIINHLRRSIPRQFEQ